MYIASLRVLHWESSHLVQNMKLSWVLLLEDQMGRLLKNLRDVHWGMLLVQDLELWEVLLMASPMERFLESLRYQIWEIHVVYNPEQMEVLLV